MGQFLICDFTNLALQNISKLIPRLFLFSASRWDKDPGCDWVLANPESKQIRCAGGVAVFEGFKTSWLAVAKKPTHFTRVKNYISQSGK